MSDLSTKVRADLRRRKGGSLMEDITITVDTEHADPLRRQIASKCGTAAERLHKAADNFAFLEADPSAARTAIEEVQTWAGLLDALGWGSADDAAGESCTLTAPREQLQDLLVYCLSVYTERLDEVLLETPQRPSVIVHRKAKEFELFEELLDRVGWPNQDGGG